MRKRMISIDERLPFPLRTVQTELGPLDVYDIPENQKAAILKKLYPFRPLPRLKEVMEDIHAKKIFKVKDFIVTREGRMNVLASPYYLEHGGTVIDWIPADWIIQDSESAL